MTEKYDAKATEQKWQEIWREARAWEAVDPPLGTELSQDQRDRKSFVLEQLPYPSGTLHMGHVLVWTIGDVLTHFRRRNGMHVLRPMAFDSFGLPAENAAILTGEHPRTIVERNIVSIRNSMQKIGWAIDWSREFSTHDPSYYRWTQWLFLRLYEAGLAYRKEAPVKWCPNDQTVLANEQVKDGRCERCGAEVISKNLAQWFFKTTAYADELLRDLDSLDWPERIMAMQRNWIGRSEGAEILFRIEEIDADAAVFTTRPDTLFGATYFVLAPEHPLVEQLDAPEIRDYVARAGAKTSTERLETKEKTGVFTGWHATNPVNGEKLPVFVADYVLTDYGTGAIMAVPAHDERDLQFARTHDLAVRTVISEDKTLVGSGAFSGLAADEGKRAIVAWLEEHGQGRPAVNFRIRDWGFSRQRYWGCPIPIIHCERDGAVPVPERDLPVLLPDIEDYRPKGEAPLASATEWMQVTCPVCGGKALREPETMDTFVDSAWYFIRYCDPRNDEAPWDRAIADYWMPVDDYTGGVDHVTVHMIYARFFQKALADLGLIEAREPFAGFFANGWVKSGGAKISKRAGNMTGPDQIVEQYGADAVRMYILFLGPADQDMEWTEAGAAGMTKFVSRLWRIVSEVAERTPRDCSSDDPLARKAHATIARVTDDLGRRRQYNTPIAAVMELVNELSGHEDAPGARFAAETAVSLLQPYAPHVTEELWSRLGHERLWEQPWPAFDESMLERETVQLVLQVNGKVRDRIEVPAGLSDDELVAHARSSEKVQQHLNGGEARAFVVPDKLVNLVI